MASQPHWNEAAELAFDDVVKSPWIDPSVFKKVEREQTRSRIKIVDGRDKPGDD